MKRFFEKVKRFYEENDKKALFVFVLLRILVIICLIREMIIGNFENVLFCILTLFLFVLPYVSEKIFKIDFPSILEIIVLMFIFSAEILGEINNFYGTIPFWDKALHTINGFLCASIGFSLIYILNQKTKFIRLSPVFVILFSFCFSMTVGVIWEIFEYGMDVVFKTDMQKDKYINEINSVNLDPEFDNNVISVDEIKYTIAYDENDKELVKLDGYLDIGIHDTMMDLIVNFIGALIFSIFGYLYILNNKKYKLVGNLMMKKKE